MNNREIVPFRPEEHVDFRFSFVPEAGFWQVLLLFCALAVGGVWYVRKRRGWRR